MGYDGCVPVDILQAEARALATMSSCCVWNLSTPKLESRLCWVTKSNCLEMSFPWKCCWYQRKVGKRKAWPVNEYNLYLHWQNQLKFEASSNVFLRGRMVVCILVLSRISAVREHHNSPGIVTDKHGQTAPRCADHIKGRYANLTGRKRTASGLVTQLYMFHAYGEI